MLLSLERRSFAGVLFILFLSIFLVLRLSCGVNNDFQEFLEEGSINYTIRKHCRYRE